MFQFPPLPGSQGLPVQFVLKTTEPALRLNEVSRDFLAQAQKSGMFMFIDTDLKYDLPQSVIEIDRDKAAQIGLNMTQVGSSLGSLLGGGYVNYFSMQTRSYKVIPQVQRTSRLNVSQLLDYPIANIGDVPVPLSTIAHIRTETVPETLNHFQQLNSATLSGVASPGVSQADALNYLKASRGSHAAERLHRRLRGTVAAVRAGVRRRHGHLRIRHRHRLPDARRALREFPRPAGDPDLGSAFDRGRADLHRSRACTAPRSTSTPRWAWSH